MSASRLPSLLLLAGAVLAERAPAQTFFHLDSKATYLHVNADAAHDSTPIALAPLGAVPGQCIRIRQFGKYDNGPGGETFTSTIGVFSADPTLLGGSLLLPANWPAGLPSDFSLYFQAWVADAAGPHGFSASNGLSATTP